MIDKICIIHIFRYMTKYDNNLRALLRITGALSDETRVRILMMLDIAELCVCQITAALNLAPSTVSKHLSILEDADLILRRKSGRWVFYRLNVPEFSPAVRNAMQMVRESIAQSLNVTGDREKVKELLQEDVLVTCKRLHYRDYNPKTLRGKANEPKINA